MTLLRQRPTTADVLSLANLVTIIGGVITVVGCFRLNAMSGLVLVVIGRVADVFDGPIARRTHTSRFGALLDATIDKFLMLALLISVYHFKLVPFSVIAYLFIYHLIIGVINILAEHLRANPSAHPSGKVTILIQTVALLLFVAAHYIATTHSQLVHDIAIAAAIVSVPLALKSTTDYWRTFWAVRHKEATGTL